MGINQFSVQVYGDLVPYSHTISKARVRIFHRGFNRNGSYISDDVAAKLVASLAYAPVKGIFDQDKKDFLGHGVQRHDGKAYGLIPNPTNFNWEKHIDPDGVEREYACADVLLWTGIYEEASQILGKAQSMELYSPVTKGSQRMVQGKYVFYFEDAAFAGLQVLGDEVEPCFLGANFFAHDDQIESLLRALNGGTKMKAKELGGVYVSDTSLNDIILDSDFAKKYVIGPGASQVREIETDEEAETDLDKVEEDSKKEIKEQEEKVAPLPAENTEDAAEVGSEDNFTTPEENDEESKDFGKPESEKEEDIPPIKTDTPLVNQDPALKGGEGNENAMDVSDDTPTASTDSQSVNTSDGVVSANITVTSDDFSAEEEENAQTIEVENESGLSEREELSNLYNFVKEENAALKETINNLETELVSLREFKLSVERLEKDKVLNEYAIKLPKEFVDDLRENLDQYTVNELEKEIGYYLLKNTDGNFSHKAQSVHKPKNLEGLQAILSQYKK